MAKIHRTIPFEDGLWTRLTIAAKAQDGKPEDLVLACVEQHLETALRHRVLIERLEVIDAQIDAIATFVDKVSAGSGTDEIDLSQICRYPCEA